MATKKKDETGLVPAGMADLMAPAEAPVGFSDEEAGLGSEDVSANDVVLPRISLLQGLSKPVSEELVGARQGAFWVTPYNRPASKDSKDHVKFVVVRIYPAQRMWTPIDEGGGLVCEAAGGDHVAREPMGLAGADLNVTHDNGVVKSLEWVNGRSTASCAECVYGPAAAAAAAGRAPTGRGNAWMPKYINFEGERLRVPDELRAPRCTSSLDVLGLIALPAFEDEDSGMQLGPEIIPCLLYTSDAADE